MARSILYGVAGDDYIAVHDWRRPFPDTPFLGIRVEGSAIAVVFEPRTANGPLDVEVVRRIRRLFEERDMAWTDDQVFIYTATTLDGAHQFAKRVYREFHRHGDRTLIPSPDRDRDANTQET
jgi:hypothetical protein